MKTYSIKAKEIKQKWVVVDAMDKPIGRLATHVASVLRGKDKPVFSRHMDTGDYVIVVNASKVKVTGDKLRQKFYYSHSMYPGGLRQVSLLEMLETHPDRVIQRAVKGMLPRGNLGTKLLKKLRVYSDASHPHEAQIKGGEKALTREMTKKVAAATTAQSPTQPTPEAKASETAPATRKRRTQAESSPSTSTPRGSARKE